MPQEPVDPVRLRGDALVASLLRRCTFPPSGEPVSLAVSGGADSTALAVLAVAGGCVVTAHHVDHHLRSDSALDAQHVLGLARRLGIDAVIHDVVVAPGPDLENRARQARHDALPPGTLFGHTADDQAETVLLALLRGTGPDGLAAMAPHQHPMLALRRHETEDLCERLGLGVRHDPSNDDPSFRRNRVRHELLPLANDVAQRDVVPLLARLAELQRDLLVAADLAIDATGSHLDPASVSGLAGLSDPLVARLLRRWWREVTGSAHAPDAAATGRMVAVARGRQPRCDVVGGWVLARRRGRLHLEAPPVPGRSRPANVPDDGIDR